MKLKNDFPYRLNLQFFAADDNGGDQSGDQQPDQNAGGDQSQQQQQDQQDNKTFTQEDVNNIVARETKKATEKLLRQLGIEDFENAKEGLKKFKEWQDSQKTEAQKQAERLESLEKEKGSLVEQNATLKAQLSALKAGVKAESVEDVVVLAKNLVTDEVDMDQAIQKVLEKYPHFKAQQDAQEDNGKKPRFTKGQHQKGGATDPFIAALGLKGGNS